MAVITSASSGNFSAPATWVGGVVPGVNDDAVAATTHVVTIDVDVTVLSFQQAGTGKFILGNSRIITGNVIANAGTYTSGGTIEVTATTGNNATINGNISGVSSTANNIAGVVVTGSGHLIVNGSVTGSAGNATAFVSSAGIYTNVTNTITINGNVTGGTGTEKIGCHSGLLSNTTWNIFGNVVGSTSAVGSVGAGVFIAGTSPILNITGTVSARNGLNDSIGVAITSTGVANITGEVTGFLGTRCAHVRLNGNGTVNITGNVSILGTTATTFAAIYSTALSPTVNVTGNVSGHAFVNGIPGIDLTGNSSIINVIGNVVGLVSLGTRQTGGTPVISVSGSASASLFQHAIQCDATSGGVIFQGDIIDDISGRVAIFARVFRMTATANGVTKYASGPNNPFGTLVSRVASSNSAGMPAISNVRSGIIYGAVNEFTGTVAVPTASQVMYGVPVDGSTGTAEFDLQTVADIIEAQVSAGAYERTTL